jgi:membrane protease YdiL (CAAX protease family)
LAIPLRTAGVIGIGLAVCILGGLSIAMWLRLRSAKAPITGASDVLPATPAEFAVFIAFSLIVGVSWELLFRGYLLWSLQPHIGLIPSVLLAAGAYGVAHGFKSPRAFAGSLLSALIFTAAYAATRSLWWLMIIHSGLPLLGAFASHAQRRAVPVPAPV